MLESGALDVLPERIVRELQEHKFLVPTVENELESILAENDHFAARDGSLYIVIQPTASCQLGCHYCGQKHTGKMISSDDQVKILERVAAKLKTKTFKSLTIGWFGAEPLIALPVIQKMTQSFLEIAHENGCTYAAKMATNGLLLTPEVAEELANKLYTRAIEVTLDGTAESHNLRRHKKSGKATFDTIFNNLIAVAALENLATKISIRCNVDSSNYQSVIPLIELLAAHGLQNRFTFYVAPIHSWGNDAHESSLSKEDFAEIELLWFVELAKYGFSVHMLPQRQPIVCMSVMPNAELIDAYGAVFNCTEVSYVPAYGEPNEYAIDHLSGRKMPGNRERLGSFNQQIRDGNLPCYSCKMLPVCGGACPKSWHENIEPCPSTKYNIEKRLLISYALSRLSAQKTLLT